MNQNKLSLEERIQKEQEERAHQKHSPLRMRFTEQSPEMRATEEKLNNLQYQLASVIDRLFHAISTKAKSPTLLLVIPGMLARHHTLGTNTAMNILHVLNPNEEDDIDALLSEIHSTAFYVPETHHLAWQLTDDYRERERNLAECYWLLKLCNYLHCTNQAFAESWEEFQKSSQVPSHTMHHAAQYTFSRNSAPVNPAFIDFIKPLSESSIYNHLRLLEFSTNQYKALENWLHRL